MPETWKPLLDAASPVIIMAVVWLLNRIAGRMPQVLAPILATVLGPLAAWLSALATNGEINWVVAWLCGLAAIGIHQHGKKGGRAVMAIVDNRRLPIVGASGRTP